MKAMKGKGPGDKVARLGKKAEKAVAKVEKAAVKGALKSADKARKRLGSDKSSALEAASYMKRTMK